MRPTSKCVPTLVSLLVILLLSGSCLIGQEVDGNPANPQSLKVPSKIFVPSDIPSWAGGNATEEEITYPSSIYERCYSSAWNEFLELYGNGNDLPKNATDVEPLPADRYALRGRHDGLTDCKRLIAKLAESDKQLARNLAKRDFVEEGFSPASICISLAAPTSISIPDDVFSWQTREDTDGNVVMTFPSDVYRRQYVARWNETLYNFGVRKLPLDCCETPIRIVAVPKVFEDSPKSTAGSSDCIKQLQFLLKTQAESELRQIAVRSIPRSVLSEISNWPGFGSMLDGNAKYEE